MNFILRISPLQALSIVIGSIFVVQIAGPAVVLMAGGSIETASLAGYLSVGIFVLYMLLMGYPFLVALHLLRRFGRSVGGSPRRLTAAFLVATLALLGFVGTIASAGPMMDGGPPSIETPAIAFWGIVFVGLIYMMISAARALVLAERQRKSEAGGMVATFFMFYFLPVCIYVLQRRLLRVMA